MDILAELSSGNFYIDDDNNVFWLKMVDYRDEVAKDFKDFKEHNEDRATINDILNNPRWIIAIKNLIALHDYMERRSGSFFPSDNNFDKNFLITVSDDYPRMGRIFTIFSELIKRDMLKPGIDISKLEIAADLNVLDFKYIQKLYNYCIDRNWFVKYLGIKEPERLKHKFIDIIADNLRRKWANRIFYIEPDNGAIHYISEALVQCTNDMNYRRATLRNIRDLLAKRLQLTEKYFKRISSGERWQYTKYASNDPRLKNSLPYYAYGDSSLPVFDGLIESMVRNRYKTFWTEDALNYDEKRGSLGKIIDSDFTAPFVALVYKGKFDIINEKIRKSEEQIDHLTKEDCPEIPNIDKNIKLFPHQALALAVLDKKKNGIIDIDMGGGKLLIYLADCLNQMNKGRVKRPLIVMPNNTLMQQKKEIERFTNDTINVFVINSDTVKQYPGSKDPTDLDELEKVVTSMPPNTIFLTSYEWLSHGYKYVNNGRTRKTEGKTVRILDKDFVRSKWLLNKVHIDMVTLDESHHIKNPTIATTQATLILSKAPVKRIGSGTLMPSNPQDLISQTAFLDPSILGGFSAFCGKYAKYIRNKRVLSWKEGAAKEIRKELKKAGGISIRRSAWMAMMPKRKEYIWKVNLTKKQQAAYEKVINDILDEIMNDPVLRKKYEEFENSNSDEEYGFILQKLGKVDSFLCNPAEEAKYLQSFDDQDKISPKIIMMDKLIERHFSSNDPGKIIVFTQRKLTVQSVMKYSKYKDIMVPYDATIKQNLDIFKNDPNKKILVAVDNSLMEGHNLQNANCIIRLDIHWNPGSMDQSYGRVFRFGQKRVVYIHTILTDNTAEVPKYARLVSKEHIIRKINSDFDDRHNLELIRMNFDTIRNKRDFNLLRPYQERHIDILQKELKEADIISAKIGNEPVEIKSAPNIEGFRVKTPNLDNSTTLYSLLIREYTLKNRKKDNKYWLVDDNSSILNLTKLNANKLGFIWSNKANIWYRQALTPIRRDKWREKAENMGYDTQLIVMKNKILPYFINSIEDERALDPTIQDNITEELDNSIELNLLSMNNKLTLSIPRDSNNSSRLRKFGFVWKKQYMIRKVDTKGEVFRLLQKIENLLDVEIKNKNELLDSINRQKVLTGQIPNLIFNKKKSKSTGELSVYYATINGKSYLMVPMTEADRDLLRLKILRFTIRPAEYIVNIKNGKFGVSQMIKKLTNAGFKITNWNSLFKALKKFGIVVDKSLSSLAA